MDIILVLSSICISLFGLLGLFLISTSRGNIIANKFLGVFFLLWAIDFLDGVLMLGGFFIEYPNAALWTDPLILLYGPIIYIYTRFQTHQNAVLNKKDILHLLPWFLFFLSTFFIYHLQPTDLKIKILREVVEMEQTPGTLIVFMVLYLHFIIYIFASKSKIKHAIQRIEEYYANHNLSWLNSFLNVLLLVLIISTVSSLMQFGFSRYYFELSLTIVLLITTLFVGYLVLKAMDSPAVLIPNEMEKNYAGQEISIEESEAIAEKIRWNMNNEKLYLEPEFNLKDLSEHIGESTRRVSQVLNETMKTRFFDLVNNYRIDAAKELLLDSSDPSRTILEVLYTVGYNSKSSFNTQFKKKTGITPSEFVRQHRDISS